jgi:hypothetical protein
MMYVVKAPRPFLLFAVGLVLFGYVQNLRAAQKLPTQEHEEPSAFSAAPVPRELQLEVKRKTADYGQFLIFLLPGFAIAGAISLVFVLATLRTGPFEWKRLSDLIIPGAFLLVGVQGTKSIFVDRLRTQKILNSPVCVMGVVTTANESGLRYRFRDLAGLEHEGSGSEYSGDYYEEMEVPIVYERNSPVNNLPVSALYDEYDVKFRIV